MRRIKYQTATGWQAASAALAANKMARPIAGGSDLLGWIKEDVQGLNEPRWETLVDIRTISGSDRIEATGSGLTLGPLATLYAIETSPEIQKQYPLLAKAAAAAASPNIRHSGTIGGNVNQRPRCWYLRNEEFDCYKKGGKFCFAVTGKNEFHAILDGELCYIVHPSDTAPALMALHAEAVIQSPGKEQVVPFEKYFIGPREDVLRENILKQGDLLKEIRIPAPKAGTGQSFIKAQRRGSTYDFAVVNVATAITKKDGKADEVSIVLSGVAPTPYRATAAETVLKGKAITLDLAREAANQTLLKARPMTENVYKVAVAKNLIIRSVMEAFA